MSCHIQAENIQRDIEFLTRATLDLAREYYGNKKFKQKDVRPMKLVDFEGIAQYHSENIILLVYGKIQHKNELPTINMGL